ncbi:hypothetical protein B0H13DRAFT_1862929 [Mycena leptocephala]|nr:hypothetical protein B0H13DRAFT_1862929 [Mycena leptocephala]
MQTGIAAGSKISRAPQLEVEESSDEQMSDSEPQTKRPNQGIGGGVQMTKRAQTQKRKERETNLSPNPANKNGWLWELRRPSNMTDAEMTEWESENIPIFRGIGCSGHEQKQRSIASKNICMELKLAEFLLCLASFEFNEQIWTQMSAKPDLGPGFAERAKETAYIWKQLSDQCRKHLAMAGYNFALEPDFNLITYFEKEREKHDDLLGEQGIVPRDKRAEARVFAASRDERVNF